MAQAIGVPFLVVNLTRGTIFFLLSLGSFPCCVPPAPPPRAEAEQGPKTQTLAARTIHAGSLPPGLAFPGKFITGIAWRDGFGANILVISETVEHRHEPGVRWSPTEFVAHAASHYAGDTAQLKIREERLWNCSNPDRYHRTRAPTLSDVDGDGIAEVVGFLDYRCGNEEGALEWAFEDGSDLFQEPPEGKHECGGDGRMSSSLRSTAFEKHMRSHWLLATGKASDDNAAVPPNVMEARKAFQSAPVRTNDIHGAIEDGLLWSDASGDNALVLARVADTNRISATVLRKDATGWSVLARLEAGGDGCPEDDATRHELGAVNLTDLDGDAIREVTFAYQTGCVSDVSPVEANLILIEGKERHTIWGRTWVDIDSCAPPQSLVFDNDPIARLLDKIDPHGFHHLLPR
jgi:hypothetical protein